MKSVKQLLQTRQIALAALGNERVTRQRVSDIEDWVRSGLWSRIRWLLFGAPKPKIEAPAFVPPSGVEPIVVNDAPTESVSNVDTGNVTPTN